jgi:hypothetical protein
MPKLIPASLRQSVLLVLALVTFAITFACAPTAQAQINCAALSHWSNTTPAINLRHVFCGEWSQNRPKGFHSRPGGTNPATVSWFKVTQSANRDGIYGGYWRYANHPEPDKFSTMFPDSCSSNEVMRSVVYAATHPWSCPGGAPGWASCGPNRPSDQSQGYCQGNTSRRFSVAMGRYDDGRVNTAFPIRE